MKRIAPGFYTEDVTRKADGAVVELAVVRTDKPDHGPAGWYYTLDGGNAEDWFPTKADAEKAGRTFAEKCYLDEKYGWCLKV